MATFVTCPFTEGNIVLTRSIGTQVLVCCREVVGGSVMRGLRFYCTLYRGFMQRVHAVFCFRDNVVSLEGR